MVEMIFYVAVVMGICGLLLSPFYFIGRKKRALLKQEAEEKRLKMSKTTSALCLTIEAILCIAFFLYLLLKDELNIYPVIGWLVFLGLAVAVMMEAKRRQ